MVASAAQGKGAKHFVSRFRSSLASPRFIQAKHRQCDEWQINHIARYRYKPSCAGSVDMRPTSASSLDMVWKNGIAQWIKALVCLTFALALMFSVPSALHSVSGMHDAGHAAAATSTQVDHAQMAGGHKGHSTVSTIDTSDQDTAADEQCCSGICISVALCDENGLLAVGPAPGGYLVLDRPNHTTEPQMMLRPPRKLI
ncbi:hypothetical protein SAMN05444149_101498 [Pseudosulfitobacter pseudonitzschiae]|nr:hypothetical protein [Pseudosulfitobacter pseudonitzschiae]QKS09068.1 hypothetical protein HT745_11590 [Pseudosulfitobacter pseudonitzschiae]SHE57201.1 hypothetical protein SAMN05444149_101498 [Pseudosulfitobacter pseudonitzschiae]